MVVVRVVIALRDNIRFSGHVHLGLAFMLTVSFLKREKERKREKGRGDVADDYGYN